VSDGLLEQLAGPRRPLSLLELGRVLGGLRWVELEAFRVLGERAKVMPAEPGEPGLAVHPGPALAMWASASSMAHAWRALQLEALLPVSVGLPTARECTGSPGPAATDWVASLGSAVAGTDDDGRGVVVGWYGVLAEAYGLRVGNSHPSADGPVVRTLGRLGADVLSVARQYVPQVHVLGREA
jgi:hypothetical protein